MLVGGWLEALYILSQVNEANPTPELTERIGEQKVFFDKIVFLLDLYKEDTYFKNLGRDLSQLKKAFSGVEVKITEGEEIEKEVNGTLVIESTSTSQIIMSEEVLAKITSITKDIRSTLIGTDEK